MVILASEPARSREVMAAGGLPRDLMAAPLTGEPFSAIWTNEIVRTLSDDAHITKHGHHFVTRDSAGRERGEMRLLAAKLESQNRSWWLLLTRSRIRSDHVERGNEWTPAGRIGNDVPITDTHEVWTSNAMKLVLLQK
jgi:hypothetical protein